jgi:L-asparaginase II
MPGAGLVEVTRGGVVESRHAVHVAVCDADGRLVAACGDPRRVTTLRSAAKPWQAQPLVAGGAADAFGLGGDVLAVACASHLGQDVHVAAVGAGLGAAGLAVGDLQTCAGGDDERIRHNCSGNHLAFLAASRHAGWDVASYRRPEHPSQRAALAAVAAAARVPESDVATGVDGCGVVAFALPLSAVAAMYARMPAELPRQHAAMRARPELVRGDGSLDTELARAVPGAAAKAGAEALECVALGAEGLGIAVRVEDGGWRAAEPAALAAVRQVLGWDGVPSSLERFVAPAVRNGHGDVVGGVATHLPLI